MYYIRTKKEDKPFANYFLLRFWKLVPVLEAGNSQVHLQLMKIGHPVVSCHEFVIVLGKYDHFVFTTIYKICN